jgi:N utilization substance protein B
MSEETNKKSPVLEQNASVTTVHRKKTRKYLYQKLYARTFSSVDASKFDEAFYTNVLDFDMDVKYIDQMFELILEKEAYLLKIISVLAPKFKIKSMSVSYILPVFIGACEMLYLEEEIPGKVSINEAVEMAKVFGDDSAKKVVNGVMNKLYKEFDEIQRILEEFDGKSEITLFS